MKILPSVLCSLLVSSAVLANDNPSPLFRATKPLFEDDFSAGTIDTTHWQVRQGSTWGVEEGVLVGRPSSKEFQDKKIAAGDKAHAGFKPVMWLEQVPQNLVAHFRVRFDAKNYHPRFPLIDVGHHVNTLTFAKSGTKLTLKKNQKVIPIQGMTIPLNTWCDVLIELKPGSLRLRIDDVETTIHDPLIDMIDQQQIDFKGVDHGAIRIDNVKILEGLQ